MHISNFFFIVCNIQIVFQMLCHGFETLLLFIFVYLMIKSGKSFVKIRPRYQITLSFYFIEISTPSTLPRPPTHRHLFQHLPHLVYLILPNVPTQPLIRTLPPILPYIREDSRVVTRLGKKYILYTR